MFSDDDEDVELGGGDDEFGGLGSSDEDEVGRPCFCLWFLSMPSFWGYVCLVVEGERELGLLGYTLRNAVRL